jgi:hypothetical protein
VKDRYKAGTSTRREEIKEINKMAKPEAKKKKRKGKPYNTFQVKFLTKRKRKRKIKHNYFYAVTTLLKVIK